MRNEHLIIYARRKYQDKELNLYSRPLYATGSSRYHIGGVGPPVLYHVKSGH